MDFRKPISERNYGFSDGLLEHQAVAQLKSSDRYIHSYYLLLLANA